MLAPTLSRKIKAGTQVMIRITPGGSDEPKLLVGVTDPEIG